MISGTAPRSISTLYWRAFDAMGLADVLHAGGSWIWLADRCGSVLLRPFCGNDEAACPLAVGRGSRRQHLSSFGANERSPRHHGLSVFL
jgi:hypothetical protein